VSLFYRNGSPFRTMLRLSILRLSLSRPRWQSCRRTIFQQKGKNDAWLVMSTYVWSMSKLSRAYDRSWHCYLLFTACYYYYLIPLQFSSAQSLWTEQLLKRNRVHVCVYAGWSLLVSVRLHYRVDCRDCASRVVNLLHTGLKKKLWQVNWQRVCEY